MRKKALLISTLLGTLILVPLHPGDMDVIVMVDTSQSMLPFFDELKEYLLRDLLQRRLRPGIQLHLLSFADQPELELSSRLEGGDGLREVVERILLLTSLGRYTDLANAVHYLYSFTESLPRENSKLILLLTDGIHDPPPGSPYGDVNPERVRQDLLERARQIRQQGWSVHILKFPTSVAESVREEGTERPGEERLLEELAEALDGEVEPYQPSSLPRETSEPNPATIDTSQQVDEPSPTTSDPSQRTSEPIPLPADPSQRTSEPIPLSADPSQRTERPSPGRPAQGPTTPLSFWQKFLVQRKAGSLFLSLLLLILLLLALALLISRWRGKISQLARRQFQWPRRRFGTGARPGFRRPIIMKVLLQNPHVGFRNIHDIPPGHRLTVGGRGSDFLIYYVPMPRRIGSITNEGKFYSFIPQRKEYFPELDAPLQDCLNKEIKALSQRGHSVRLFFQEYISPAEQINSLLRSIRYVEPLGLEESKF